MMRSLVPVIKNAEEAKTHLCNKGWAPPGEAFSLETLAKVLFNIVAEGSKNQLTSMNAMLAVAYLITEKSYDTFKQNITTAVTKHLLDAILPITTNLQTKIDLHLQAVNDSTKAHSVITEKLQLTQEQLEVTSEKVNSNAKTYSQAAATVTNPNYVPPPSTNSNITHSQIQIRNREAIKSRQVLINFDRTANADLDNLDEPTLTRKARDALNTSWAATDDPKPLLPKLKSSTLLHNGNLLLELDTAEAAEWL